MTFGIRNVDDPVGCITQIKRVLKKNGTALIMEFSLPENRMLKQLYLVYFRFILPFIGGMVSGNYKAYKYLNETVESFPYGDEFCDLMRNEGFKTSYLPLTFGIACLYIGKKC